MSGLKTRLDREKEAYNQAIREGQHHSDARRAGIRAYCAGNKWATENAKAVGNW